MRARTSSTPFSSPTGTWTLLTRLGLEAGFPDSSLGLLPLCLLPPWPALLELTFCNTIGARCQLGLMSTGWNACFAHCFPILTHLPTSQLSKGFFLHFFSPFSLPSLIHSLDVYHTTTMCLTLHEDHMIKMEFLSSDSREKHMQIYRGNRPVKVKTGRCCKGNQVVSYGKRSRVYIRWSFTSKLSLSSPWGGDA